MKKEQRLQKLNILKELLKGTDKKLTFSNLKPSQSGMSRTFNIHIVKNNEIIDITKLVADITENTYTNKGKMRIQGCGMDMLFETCYQINQVARYLYNKEYNHDFAYHGVVETNYNLI